MAPTSPGVWIALDGLDASGKSEQVPLVAARLREAGISPIVEIPEFSTSPVGLAIRAVLAEQRFFALTPCRKTPLADSLCLLTDMVYHHEILIKEAVRSGGIAISDRGPASIMAYQAVRFCRASIPPVDRSFALAFVSGLVQQASLRPDLTILLTIPEEEMIRRIVGRGEPTLDVDDLAFLREVGALLHPAAFAVSISAVCLDGLHSPGELSEKITNIYLAKIWAR